MISLSTGVLPIRFINRSVHQVATSKLYNQHNRVLVGLAYESALSTARHAAWNIVAFITK